IRRIIGHMPEVYVGGNLKPGLSIRGTIIQKPLYFGQKDLSAAGKGFGQDLVEKLVGDGLVSIRDTMSKSKAELAAAVAAYLTIHSDAEDQSVAENELEDVKFRLEKFDSLGVKDKLEKQVAFNKDLQRCEDIEERVETWAGNLEATIHEARESFADI